MTDAHGRLADWLAAANHGDPPRDVALHAAGCGECLAKAAAVDALAAIDPGRAPDPPLVGARPARPSPLAPLARAGAGFAAIALLGGAVLIGSAALFADRAPATGGGDTLATPAEGVLGAADGPEQAPDPGSPSSSPSSSPSPEEAHGSPEPEESTDEPDATTGPAAPAPVITVPGGAPPPTTPPTATPIGTPTPGSTVAPTLEPTPPPSPTQTPTPTPTPTPAPATPTPALTPTPTPTGDGSTATTASCSDGIDDDGDLLVDELDPGCLLGSGEGDL